MFDEDLIRKQYEEYKYEFNDTKDNLRTTLENIAGIFYQKTRFKVIVLEPRLKTIDSILSKIKRKGLILTSLFAKDNDQISLPVNDFLGARIVCNTREDVDEITEIICMHSRFKLVKPPDRKSQKTGYRAVHLDVLYHIYWKDELVYIPVEIQIKTHLQNAWANITHDESYKPENEDLKNIWEQHYSKHLADILDNLDDMASTIRKQRLSYVKPPQEIHDADTLINSKTLSYKIDQVIKGARLTQQEMTLVMNRLKEEGFETLDEVSKLLNDVALLKTIKTYKEELQVDENATPFEVLYYGPLILKDKMDIFGEEIRKDYGFVHYKCLECDRWLTKEEYDAIKKDTDSDLEFYCKEHLANHFNVQCQNCGILTSNDLCRTCDADKNIF